MQRAIEAAEDGDYSLMSDIIIMGDGQKLVGLHSKDEEVDEFLQRIPKHLVSACGGKGGRGEEVLGT